MKKRSPPPVMQVYRNGPSQVVEQKIAQLPVSAPVATINFPTEINSEMKTEQTHETPLVKTVEEAKTVTEHSPMQSMIQTILISQIDPSPFQNRIINETSNQFIDDLAANIDADTLNTPILVRKKADGRFELIAGEHRIKAFLQNKRSSIPAIVKVMDDIAAAKATVLDNVFRKNNSPYELYKGYQMLLDMKAYSSSAQLANAINISKSELSRILSFAKLPAKALAMIAKNPFLLGSNTASGLVEFSQTHPEIVIEAISKIENKSLLQNRAVGWVKSKVYPKISDAPKIRTISNKNGQTVFTIKTEKSGVTITSETPINDDISQRLYALLEQEALSMD